MVQAEQTVEVDTEGSIDISISVTNLGDTERSFSLGVSIVRPDGTIVNLEPRSTPVIEPGTSQPIEYKDVSKGCITDGPDSTEVFTDKGVYDIKTRVLTDTRNNPQACFNTSLAGVVLDRTTVQDAIEVLEIDEPQRSEDTTLVLAGVGAALGGLVLLDEGDMR